MISRRDIVCMALVPAIYLAACCRVYALDAGPSISPTLCKHPDGPRLARELLEAEPINPTPLSDELYIALLDACGESGVEVPLALGVIEVESGFDVDAVSPAGCYGLMQLNRSTFPAASLRGKTSGRARSTLGACWTATETQARP